MSRLNEKFNNIVVKGNLTLPLNSAILAEKADGTMSTINLADLAVTAELGGLTASVAELNILDTVTAVAAELNYLDITTLGTGAASKAVVLDSGDDYTWPETGILKYGVLKDPANTTLAATAAEINAACAVASIGQTITASGAVTAGKKSVLLNHETVAIASTIANAANHFGYFVVKAGLEPGAGQDHTCVITTGTWDGTNKTATFADINDALVVFFDHAGNGSVISNTGAVVLSA